jgi:outer membrane protein assembly factor BamB
MIRGSIHIVGIVACCSLCSAVRGFAEDLATGFRPELIATEVTSVEVRPGDPFSITFKFRNAGGAPADRDYRVFTHCEAPKKSCENIVIHADHVPSEPTTLWQPGMTVVDGPLTLTVPADAAPGEYFVHVGLYDLGGTGERCLDVYSPTIIRVSRAARPTAELGPTPLPESEVEKRRQARAARIETRNRMSLDTTAWRFDVDRTSGAWSLLDKAAEVLWTSSTSQPRFGRITLRNGERQAVYRIDRFDDVASTPRSLRLVAQPLIDGQPSGVTVLFTVVPSPDFEGLQWAYASRATGPWQVVSVRLLEDAFQVTEQDGGSVYVPYRLGIEVPAGAGLPGNRSWTPYDDLSMAMCGAVKQGAALLITWDQVDSRLTTHTTWPDLPLVPGRRAVSVSLELDGAANTCLIQPLGHGGYVDIAKAYRPIAQAKGWRKTWTEKRQQYPTVDGIFGAANFKPFVLSRVVPSSRFSSDGKEHVSLGFTFDEAAQCAEHWRKDLEIDRAFVVLAGWINGGYDVRHPDVLPAASECGGTEGLAAAAERIRACGFLFGLHDNYQDMYEDAPSWGETWLNKDSRGVSRQGGNWNGGQAWQVCAIKQVELAARPDTNLPAIARLFAPTVYFIDTVFAWPLVTCEDRAHPMSRRDDLFWKTNLCSLAKKHFGLFGSEEGREWSVPCADYLEGIFGHQTDSPPGQVIPLFPLVYSDCVQIMTHQGNRVAAGDEKKVADHILFAEMFLPTFGPHLYWRQPDPSSVPITPLEPVVKQTGPRRFQITYRWKALKAITEDYSVFVHFTSPQAQRAEGIVFQNDHAPTIPTTQWAPGQIIEDGPHSVDVPDTFSGTARIGLGMLRGGDRVTLAQSTSQRDRYVVGEIVLSKEGVQFQSGSEVLSSELWSRGDGGWGEQLCRTDRVIKNVWEVLSPLNRITAELPLDNHEFLTPDRLVQRTRFGDVTITVAFDKPAEIGDHRVPANGFIVDSPQYIAFCATRYNGVDYDSPTLFTAQSLDGKPLAESASVRIYHGFGDRRIRLSGRDFEVAREEVVSCKMSMRVNRTIHRVVFGLGSLVLLGTPHTRAEDWTQFRGPRYGAAEIAQLPTQWNSDSAVWKTPLEGRGASSPVTFQDRIYLTSYTGYGIDAENPGAPEDLERHLTCISLKNGQIIWTKTVPAPSENNPFTTWAVALHGFASSTPVVDATGVYVFFGATGVLAFNHQGDELWRTSCGTGTHDFGAGNSPVLYNDLVIVNASVECGELIALRKSDGREVWRQGGIEESWSTPAIYRNPAGATELAVTTKGKILAFNPADGTPLWTCDGIPDYICPSIIAQQGTIYASGGRRNEMIAIRSGGTGDVTATNKLWGIAKGSNVSSPVYYDGYLYWAKDDPGIVYCANADTGEILYEERLKPDSGRLYASPLLADGKLYYVSRQNGTYVLPVKPEFQLLALNKIEGDDSIFNASPVPVDGGGFLLRSDRFLYRIGANQ